MSVKITMLWTCDGCGSEIAKAEPRPSEIDSTRWDFDRHLQKTGGIKRTRRGGSTIHYCGKCADMPTKKRPSTKQEDTK